MVMAPIDMRAMGPRSPDIEGQKGGYVPTADSEWPLASVGRHSFDTKVALVTGASQGIGRTAAIGLARLGTKVGCVARNGDALDQLVTEIQSEGGEALAIPADITLEENVADTVARILQTFGKLDLAFNNAGTGGASRIIDTDVEEFDRVIGLNLRAQFFCMKYEISAMLKNDGGGAIVNVASAAGHAGRPGRSLYAASKWGLIGLSKSAALEYAENKVRVNVLSPGSTWTPLWAAAFPGEEQVESARLANPLRRIASTEEQAGAAIWLLSDASAFVTGAVLNVDGGITAGILGPTTSFAHLLKDSTTH
jgi:NAD(P)-dependent dehydrogenase (short-subunit alcohol dehydrogenase family)